MLRFLKKTCRVIYDAAYGFYRDDCYTKASVITFYTIQSIVPLLALLIAIAKGLGFEKYLEHLIKQSFYEQKEIFEYVIKIAHTMLSQIQGGVMAGLGIFFLLWTVINLVGYIEKVLNEIWKVNRSRPWYRKVTDYLAFFTVFPIILVVSSSLTVYLQSQISQYQGIEIIEVVGAFFVKILKHLPLFLNWMLFLFLYLFIPYGRIKIFPRFVAGILAGTAFHLWQILYIKFLIQVFSYNVVYGTFAVIPLFLIWMQFSWFIALAGAEIAVHMEKERV